jgi:YfiH family protein
MIAPVADPGSVTLSALTGIPQIRHAFFTREGGVSEGVYGSLNCGFSGGDDRERVMENRRRALKAVGLPLDALARVQQQHTAEVVVVDESWTADRAPVADGMVSVRPGIALGVLGADCASVLMADPVAKVIGAAHAGWRGALFGVLDNTLDAMTRLGAMPSRIIAAVGPCIGRHSYEVGPAFPVPFVAEDPASRFFFAPAPREGHFLFDLPGYITRRLARRSVENVVCSLCDTFRDEERFFSHRRAVLLGESDRGSMLSIIVLEQ